MRLFWIAMILLLITNDANYAAELSPKGSQSVLEKQDKEMEKAISDRIAFEKEQAQKQILQRQEDEQKSALREQHSQHLKHQPAVQTPQTITHQEGKSFASSKIGGVLSAAQSTNLQTIPGFQTDKPKEASLDVGTIGDAVLRESRSNEVSKHLISSAQDRPKFKIDPSNDPLFVDANQTINNPQKTLSEEIEAVSSTDDVLEEIKICEEGGDEYQQTCTKRLEIILKITPEIRTPYRYCPSPGHPREKFQRHGLNSGYVTVYEPCGGCQTGVHITPKDVKL
jgi:hypothetical protein